MLPESLATIPNIPWQSQTIEQLKAERDYWNSKIKSADGWGASVGVDNWEWYSDAYCEFLKTAKVDGLLSKEELKDMEDYNGQ